MQALNEKYMSDEETDNEDNNTLLKRSPMWRSEKLNKLIQKLDQYYMHGYEGEEGKFNANET